MYHHVLLCACCVCILGVGVRVSFHMHVHVSTSHMTIFFLIKFETSLVWINILPLEAAIPSYFLIHCTINIRIMAMQMLEIEIIL
jgi:hypothetical protein